LCGGDRPRHVSASAFVQESFFRLTRRIRSLPVESARAAEGIAPTGSVQVAACTQPLAPEQGPMMDVRVRYIKPHEPPNTCPPVTPNRCFSEHFSPILSHGLSRVFPPSGGIFLHSSVCSGHTNNGRNVRTPRIDNPLRRGFGPNRRGRARRRGAGQGRGALKGLDPRRGRYVRSWVRPSEPAHGS
jgi:hypothetical protein